MKTFRIYLSTGAEIVVRCDSLDVASDVRTGRITEINVRGHALNLRYVRPQEIVAVVEEAE